MNIKLLSLDEENENFEYTGWRHKYVLRSQKEGGAIIRGGATFRENTVLKCGRGFLFLIWCWAN